MLSVILFIVREDFHTGFNVKEEDLLLVWNGTEMLCKGAFKIVVTMLVSSERLENGRERHES